MASRIVERARIRDRQENITGRMRAIGAQVGGRLSGVAFKYKGVNSLTRKIFDRARKDGARKSEAVTAHGVTDALRFTTVLPTRSYVSGVKDLVAAYKAEGFEVLETDNKWSAGQAYKGFHLTLRSPGGQRFEMQIHTRRSLRMKDRLHHNYELLRAHPPPSKTEQTRLLQEQYELGKQNPTLPGVEELDRLR